MQPWQDSRGCREFISFSRLALLSSQVNIFIGLGLLSCPYAFKAGGYVSGVLLLTVIAPLFCLSGHLIVAAFQYLPLTAPRSYPELGTSLGRVGATLVGGVLCQLGCG